MATSGERWPTRREALLVLLATGLFAAGLCFIPPTLLETGDYLVLWKPNFHFLKDALHQGRLPLWNPYIHLGRPYLADMANMGFYPPTYLIFLGEKTGFFLQVWLHCLLAVFGMRKLAGALGVGRWQGYFMAFTFVGSGALTARWVAGQLPNCWSICYVPGLLYCAVRTAEPWASRRVAGHALLLALQLLCHPQVFWFSTIGQAVFIFVRSVRLPVRDALWEAGRGLGQFAVACGWCAGLTAVALMPFWELVQESNRSTNSPEFANAFYLPWSDLRYLFSPLQSTGARWETNLFVGTLVVLLGLAGLCRVRERNVRGLLGMLVIALLISLGDLTPVFGLFCKWLPGYIAFRFHSRAALLVVVALICAAGIWLSRPHPRLRLVWTWLFGVPVHYAFILLVVLQSLDLLQGNWMIKRVITGACLTTVRIPLDDSFERDLVAELWKARLIQPSLPPPRVCMPPNLVPVNYGMIHHYAQFDAACPLFLLRPWNYLHAARRVLPAIDKGSLSPQVYAFGPFPYRDLSLAMGFDFESGRLVTASDPSPRALVVYAAEVADYRTIINRLVRGHDIRQSALLEDAFAEPLPQVAPCPGTTAAIRRFEANWLLVDVEARTNALLVLSEAWYPGWRAEIDGQVSECVPANGWMRAVAVPAGRHQVRVYFRQNSLLRGLVISLASLILLLVAMARVRSRAVSPPQEADVGKPLAPCPAGNQTGPSHPLTSRSSALATYRPLFRVLAAAVVLALVWLVAGTKNQQERRCLAMSMQTEAMDHLHIVKILTLQKRTARVTAHCAEAVRLAKRACELTDYNDPVPFGTLANAYAGAARFDEALEAASKGRDLALACGQKDLDEIFRTIMDYCNAARQPGHAEDRN